MSVYRRHCNPSPFTAVWGRAVWPKWWSHTQFSVGVWVILTNVLFCWSGEWNTINHTGTLIPFLALMRGGEATDLPCHKVTPLLCQVSVACTCLESSWLPQSHLLTGRVAPSRFLSGAVIPRYLLADSNQAFEGLQGVWTAVSTARVPNHQVFLATSREQGSRSGYLFCCVGKIRVCLWFPPASAFLGIVPVQLMLSLSPWPACMS